MQCGNVLCAKQARVLSRNEIGEIIMDLDSKEDKYYASQEWEDKRGAMPTFRTVFHFTASKYRLE